MNGEWLDVLNRLRNLRPDWNGDASDPPTGATLRMSEAFLKNIPPGRRYPDEIWPDGDGCVCMEWKTGPFTTNLIVDGKRLHMIEESGDKTERRIDERQYRLGVLDPDVISLIPLCLPAPDNTPSRP